MSFEHSRNVYIVGTTTTIWKTKNEIAIRKICVTDDKKNISQIKPVGPYRRSEKYTPFRDNYNFRIVGDL